MGSQCLPADVESGFHFLCFMCHLSPCLLKIEKLLLQHSKLDWRKCVLKDQDLENDPVLNFYINHLYATSSFLCFSDVTRCQSLWSGPQETAWAQTCWPSTRCCRSPPPSAFTTGCPTLWATGRGREPRTRRWTAPSTTACRQVRHLELRDVFHLPNLIVYFFKNRIFCH